MSKEQPDSSHEVTDLGSGRFRMRPDRDYAAELAQTATLLDITNSFWSEALAAYGRRVGTLLARALESTSYVEEELVEVSDRQEDGTSAPIERATLLQMQRELQHAQTHLRDVRDLIGGLRRLETRVAGSPSISFKTVLKVTRGFWPETSQINVVPLEDSPSETDTDTQRSPSSWIVRGDLYQNVLTLVGIVRVSALLIATEPADLNLQVRAVQVRQGTRVELTLRQRRSSTEAPPRPAPSETSPSEFPRLGLHVTGMLVRSLGATLEAMHPIDGGIQTILLLDAPTHPLGAEPVDTVPSPSAAYQSRSSGDYSPTEAPLLLLVLPSNTNAQALEQPLVQAGFEIERTTNGAEALSRIAAKTYATVVTARQLPLMNGLEFIKAVRKLDLDIPVVMLDESESSPASADALTYGAIAVLEYPVDPDELAECVSNAVKVRQLARLRRLATFHHELPEPELPDRAAFEGSFERALQALWIAYHPVVRCSERTTLGYEALLRSDELGLETPHALFDAAQKLNAQALLGRSTRAHIAETLAQTRGQWGGLIFVNLHSSDLNDNELYSSSGALNPYASNIILEVTERTGLSQVSGLLTKIRALRARGFRIAVDDLGSGYSNLSSFLQLSPDYVKIDSTLVRGIHEAPRKRSLVRGLIHLCGRDLGAQIICEGVESPHELDALVHLGVDLFQGYLFARPSRGFQTPYFPPQ